MKRLIHSSDVFRSPARLPGKLIFFIISCSCFVESCSFDAPRTEASSKKGGFSWESPIGYTTTFNGYDWADYKNEEWQVVELQRIFVGDARRQFHRRSPRTLLKVSRGSRQRGRTLGRPPGIEYFHFKGFGRSFRLRLKPNRKVLSSDFAVYRNRAGGEIVEDISPACSHLIGRLQSPQIPSIVALTRCSNRGMTGYIRTADEDFFLEPLVDSPPIKEHRLYRKFHGKAHFWGSMSEPSTSPWHHFPNNDSWYPRSSSGKARRDAVSHGPPFGPTLPIKTVEVLLTLDKSMTERHGHSGAVTLSLTAFNMVAALFLDSSIGHPVHIVLVALVLLEHEQPGFPTSFDARQLLHHFCLWQSTISAPEPMDYRKTAKHDEDSEEAASADHIGHSPKKKRRRQSHRHRHDHAVLLTAIDFCAWKDEPCDTLGFAPIEGMCDPRRSCSLTKDTGLSVAYTIAHEIGHNLGMTHDGDDEKCPPNSGTIMSPSLQAVDGLVSWSECSRIHLRNFVSSEQSECLSDRPSRKLHLRFQSLFPGQVYDAHAQCRLQYGPKSKVCPFDFVKSICRTLWCQSSGRKCESKFLPAAEGTPCGPAKWCRKGECVHEGDSGPIPVDGQWSVWSQWSSCSQSCGGGIRKRDRKCDNPRPSYGGKFCLGNSAEYLLCNLQKCHSAYIPVRDAQCATFNKKPFRGHIYEWIAYTERLTGHSRCKLYCRAKGWDFVALLSEKVPDGVPCVASSVSSSASLHLTTTSRRWMVLEEESPPSAMGERCVEGRCRKVGCDGLLDSTAIFDACGLCGGDNSTCRRRPLRTQPADDVQEPQLSGPECANDLLRGCSSPSPKEVASGCSDWNSCLVRWVTGEWNPCTGCGQAEMLQGIQRRKVACHVTVVASGRSYRVGRRRCEILDGPRPLRKRACACPPRWAIGQWGPCVVLPVGDCGQGTKTRPVSCRGTGEMDRNQADLCAEMPPPASAVPCRVPCTGRWYGHPWSQCTASCGTGWRVREVTCEPLQPNVQKDSPVTCPSAAKPSSLSQCHNPACTSSFNPRKWHPMPARIPPLRGK